jgi:hypothetical protein
MPLRGAAARCGWLAGSGSAAGGKGFRRSIMCRTAITTLRRCHGGAHGCYQGIPTASVRRWGRTEVRCERAPCFGCAHAYRTTHRNPASPAHDHPRRTRVLQLCRTRFGGAWLGGTAASGCKSWSLPGANSASWHSGPQPPKGRRLPLLLAMGMAVTSVVARYLPAAVCKVQAGV